MSDFTNFLQTTLADVFDFEKLRLKMDVFEKELVENAYVEAALVTHNDTVYAVPEESILNTEGSIYISSRN